MPKNQKTLIALFNYGGGMRGLIPAHFMAKFEEVTGLRMADMVDIFSGPSTGAILNAAMNLRHPDNPDRPKYRARHMVRFYEREGTSIFPPDRFREFRGIVHDFNNRTLRLNQLNWLVRHGHYDTTHLARALKALYGDSRLSDSLRTLIIPTYNIDSGRIEATREPGETGESPVHTRDPLMNEGGQALWLKNVRLGYPAGAAAQTPDVALYDAVMASCAAPTYFPCHHFQATFPEERGRARTPLTTTSGCYTRDITAIDGCIFDNPCISYLGAIRRHVPPGTRLVMIVLGTGYTNRSIKKDDWNRFGALGVVDPVNDLPLINIFFHASESALMDTFAEEMGKNLYIFNKSLVSSSQAPDMPSTQIDDASPENLKAMRNFFEGLVEENKNQFEEVCHLLATNRDRREDDKRENIGEKVKKYFNLFENPVES